MPCMRGYVYIPVSFNSQPNKETMRVARGTHQNTVVLFSVLLLVLMWCDWMGPVLLSKIGYFLAQLSVFYPSAESPECSKLTGLLGDQAISHILRVAVPLLLA